MKQRIWELDAFRGVCILGMVLIHFLFDLIELFGAVDWTYPAPVLWLKDWGGILFILLSGICVTLGSRSVRRGLIVFGCGMLCTAVTAGMAALGLAGSSIVIRFGILHCLGLCMILWPVLKKLPNIPAALLAAVLIALGFWFWDLRVEIPFLFPLGLTAPGFRSADYFPLLPNLGYFLLGAVLGRTVYRQKATLFPKVNTRNPVIRFLSACGRHSLAVYLLHQPILMALFALLRVIFQS